MVRLTSELQADNDRTYPSADVASTEAFITALSIAFADPVRLKIITELFREEMSPADFHSRFGGGSLEAVSRQFRRLEQHDWLRFVRTEAGAKGRPKQVYRAPKLAVFDEAAWARLPQTLKEEFSWRIFEQFAERVNWAFEAETFDARADRHFTWTPLVLDEIGRAHVFSAIDRLFFSLFEEQRDAERRLERSGDSAVHVTVGYSAFDSPTEKRNHSGLTLPSVRSIETNPDSSTFLRRISKVFRSPLNLKIITELGLRPMSPSQFSREFELEERDISRRFRALEKGGWIEAVTTETDGQRGAARPRIFRASRPAIFDTANWARVPERTRQRSSWLIFEQMAEQIREAMTAGSFDRRPDRVHTWTPLLLDERGWSQVCQATEKAFEFIRHEEMRAGARLRVRGAKPPAIATVCLSVFESPSQPPPRSPSVDESWIN